jgi:hypothetical protein
VQNIHVDPLFQSKIPESEDQWIEVTQSEVKEMPQTLIRIRRIDHQHWLHPMECIP